MSQADFARHRGVARKSVTYWKRRGLLVMMPDGSVHVEKSDALLNARPAKYRGGTASAKSSEAPDKPAEVGAAGWEHWSLAEAARRKEIAIAGRRELDFEVASGKLVNAADVEAVMRSDYAVTATRLLQLPSKLVPRLAAMTTAAEIETFLHREVTKALNTLSKEADDQLKALDKVN